MNLSPHFTLVEMTTTSQQMANVPDAEALAALRQLCEVLEVWRCVAGPLKVTSGFRTVDVNRAIGGSKTSQHVRGEAVDVIPVNGRAQAWAHLLQLMTGPAALPIDQAIIYEDEPHIHVSHTQRYPPRRQVLVHMRDGRYQPWALYHGVLRPVSG